MLRTPTGSRISCCRNRQAFAGGGERIELTEAAPGAAARDDTFARDAPFSAE